MSLINNLLTRFPNGVNNQLAGTIFNNLPFPDQTPYHVFGEDFDYFVPASWTITETQAGATQALADGNGGLLLLTNSAADNDVNQVQKIGASFVPVVGKQLFMKFRFQLSDATQSDFAIGLQAANADGTDLAVALDGIFFLKADDAATIKLYSRQDATTGNVVSDVVATLVNATNIELAVYFDGGDRMYYAVNGTVTGYITVSTALLPNVAVAPIISLKNGAAAAKTATIDYLFIAQER